MANRDDRDRDRAGLSRSSGRPAREARSGSADRGDRAAGASSRRRSTGSSRPSNSSKASRTTRGSRAAGQSHASRTGHAAHGASAQRAVDRQHAPRAARSGRSDRAADRQPAARASDRARSTAVTRAQRAAERERASRKQRAAESLRSTPARDRAADAAEAQADADGVEYESATVGQIRRAERAQRARARSRRYIIIAVAAIGVIVALAAGWAALYNSSAFTIANVQLQGVEHLTNDEMAQLVDVPGGSTLLRVDTAAIERQVEQNAWVADAEVTRVFPDTLQVNVTERPIAAVVYISTGGGSAVKRWLISDDHVWLMPIPDADSEAAQTTSSKVYEDADSALHIVDLRYGTKAEIGKPCSDDVVNNALDIISGLTTDLSGRIAEVKAPTIADTTLILDDGVEVAFGKAEDIRDKERVVLELLEQNPNQISYINVRMVDQPTYRSI